MSFNLGNRLSVTTKPESLPSLRQIAIIQQMN